MMRISYGTRRGRRHSHALYAAACACCAGLLMTGCQGHNDADNGSGSGTLFSGGSGGGSGAAMNTGDPVATVNGDPITSGQLYDALQHYIPANVPGFPQNPMLSRPSGQAALQDLIVTTLTIQLAKQNGVPVTSDELDASFNDNKLLNEARSTVPLEQALQAQGYTLNTYKTEVLAPQVAEINLLSKTTAVTPSEMQTAYNSNLKTYTVPARVHVHRIVCSSQTQAQSVYQGVKAGRKLTDYLTDNLAGDGAGGDPTDLTTWIATDNVPPVLSSVSGPLKAAKPGAIIPPARIQGQWWVMQVADVQPSQVLPYSSVQDLVRINLIHQKSGPNAGSQIQNLLLQEMQHASITVNSPQYQGLVAQIHSYSMMSAVPSGGVPLRGGQRPATPMVVPGAPGAGSVSKPH